MSEVPHPTEEEIVAAARTLEAAFDPETGRHPAELFYATSKTVPRSTVELAIFSVDKQQVLLTPRESDDPHFPKMWHLPGVMLVTADTEGTYPDAIDNAAVRALDELEGTRVTSLLRLSPEYVNQPPRKGPRGVEIPVLYGGLLIPERPNVGQMFDVDDLPESLYEHHIPLVPACQEAMYIAPARLPIITMGTSQDSIDRRRAEASAIQERTGYYDEVSEIVSTLWDGYARDELVEKATAYKERTRSDFRKLHSGTGGFTPNSYQYPFIEVAPGLKMTFREITSGERLRGPRDGGEITAITLVAQVDGLPGNAEYSFTDRNLDNLGEMTYATVHGNSHAFIEYADPAVNDNPLLAAGADKEVLAHVKAIRDGLRTLLDNPQTVTTTDQ